MMIFTTYKHSKLATVISFISAILLFMAIVTVIESVTGWYIIELGTDLEVVESVLFAAPFAAAGAVLRFLAHKIAERKAKKLEK